MGGRRKLGRERKEEMECYIPDKIPVSPRSLPPKAPYHKLLPLPPSLPPSSSHLIYTTIPPSPFSRKATVVPTFRKAEEERKRELGTTTRLLKGRNREEGKKTLEVRKGLRKPTWARIRENEEQHLFFQEAQLIG